MKTVSILTLTLAIAAIGADRKACIEVAKEMNRPNKVRFIDDDGKKHTLTLMELDEDGAEALLESRLSAGQHSSKEVIIETADHKLVSLGKVDSICVSRARNTVALR
jgi:hypothetical protein